MLFLFWLVTKKQKALPVCAGAQGKALNQEKKKMENR